MKYFQIFFLLIFGEIFASSELFSEVSLDLTAYVDPEVNIERIDNGGTVDIFSRAESRYRITSNVDKDVKIFFNSQNNWNLKSENNAEAFIPYEGVFKSGNQEEILKSNTDLVSIKQSDFFDREYEFSMIFRPAQGSSMKNFTAGRYYDRITISVSAKD